MHYQQQLLFAYLSATAAALPSGLKERQFSGLGGLGGLSGSGTESMPLSLPTGLLGGLGGGSGTGSSPFSLPTGLLGGLGGGSGTESSPFSLPTGLLGGLGSTTGSGLDLGSLESRQPSSSSTEASLDTTCQAVTLIFARGTTELGTMGSVVGPGLSTSLKTALNNNVTVQGVDYAADAAGIVEEADGATGGTGGAGTKAMVADVQSALSKCPDTQIVLSGYSQGAMLVHNTMNTLSSTQAASVKVAVTFGDPFDGTEPKNIPKGSFKSFVSIFREQTIHPFILFPYPETILNRGQRDFYCWIMSRNPVSSSCRQKLTPFFVVCYCGPGVHHWCGQLSFVWRHDEFERIEPLGLWS